MEPLVINKAFDRRGRKEGRRLSEPKVYLSECGHVNRTNSASTHCRDSSEPVDSGFEFGRGLEIQARVGSGFPVQAAGQVGPVNKKSELLLLFRNCSYVSWFYIRCFFLFKYIRYLQKAAGNIPN